VADISPEDKLKIAATSSNSVFLRLADSSVTLLDTNPKKHELSSGTLIEVNGRVFVATARHCIPFSPQGRLWILPDRPKKSAEGMLGFITSGKHPEYDVGFLELTPESFQDYLPNKSCHSLSSIRLLGCGRENRLCTLVGSPEQFVKYGKVNGESSFAARVMSFSTFVRQPDNWPVPPTNDRPFDAAVDVVLDYPEDGTQRLDTGEPIQLKSPDGFSGGGLWDQGFEQGELWSTDSVGLFAIQSTWHESERYVRAIQIVHWLNLLRSHISELKDVIESTFPALAGMATLTKQ
jgi:hypothetical protein